MENWDKKFIKLSSHISDWSKDKNKKVNLGGPGKRTPRKTESRNRAIERKRDEKKKKR